MAEQPQPEGGAARREEAAPEAEAEAPAALADKPPAGSLSWIFSPGIGNGAISFTRLCVLSCMMLLVHQTLFDCTIHWFIMTIVSGALMLSFESFIAELRKHPEIMNPPTDPKKND
jgi:hypothetical protein